MITLLAIVSFQRDFRLTRLQNKRSESWIGKAKRNSSFRILIL
jgi:hypothetical protein